MRSKKYWVGRVRQVLVERRQMSQKIWLAQFRRLMNDIAAHRTDLADLASDKLSDGLDPREPLLWAYCTLMAMPGTQRDGYRMLRERSEEGSGIIDQIPRLREHGYRFHRWTIDKERLNWLAVVVRGLDEDLAQLHFDPSGEEDEDWTSDHWRVPGYDAFVVPVNRQHRSRDDRGADRRALALHAILPAKVGDVTIRPCYYPDLRRHAPADPERLSVGVGIFEEFAVVPALIGDQEFLVDRVVCPRQVEAMRGHVANAEDDHCDIVMWPELTIDDGARDALVQNMGQRAARRHRLALLIAGSWHVRDPSGRHYNRSYVYDGRGDLLAEVDKMRKFRFDDRYEAIEPGSEIIVLPLEDRLVGISICLDFCDDTLPDPMHAPADVDLMLVPSMGFSKTIEGHLRHASILQSRTSAQVAMVQQVPVLAGHARAANEPAGYAFLSPLRSEQQHPRVHARDAGYLLLADSRESLDYDEPPRQ